jgi:hypothetical protein
MKKSAKLSIYSFMVEQIKVYRKQTDMLEIKKRIWEAECTVPENIRGQGTCRKSSPDF